MVGSVYSGWWCVIRACAGRSEDLDVRLSGQQIVSVERRAKYLLIGAEVGTLISHLGMSGSLRMVAAGTPAAKHDHGY